jgi:hypothetical protein
MSRVLGFVLAAAVTAAPAVALAHRHDAVAERPALIESGSCARIDPTAPRNSVEDAGGANATITVSIPAVAIVHVNSHGRVVSALTNTGCAPRPGDALYVIRPDGTLTLWTNARATHMHWTGDFTQIGVLQPQGAERNDSN